MKWFNIDPSRRLWLGYNVPDLMDEDRESLLQLIVAVEELVPRADSLGEPIAAAYLLMAAEQLHARGDKNPSFR